MMVKVIRIHQYLDRIMTAIINECLVESHYLDVERIPFALRVELAVAIGAIDKEDRSPLLFFNTMRNRFAHDPNTELTEKDSRDFYNVFPKQLRVMLDREYESFEDLNHAIAELSICLYIKVEHSLHYLRDSKLWQRAYSEETRAVVAKLTRSRDLQGTSPAGERIKVRFEQLKAAQDYS